jgi:methylmalonyl-CoA/ethylmalonyl-CoA epimerase
MVSAVGNIGAVLGRIGPGLRQQAFVVTDLVGAQDSMKKSFGCTEFFLFEMTVPWQLRGRTVQCDLAVAFGRSGNMQIELIQPLRGEGVHFELLAARGPSAHHLGFYVDDLEAMSAAADGFAPVMSGHVGRAQFCYLDTIDALGIYVELIQDPDDMIMKMMPWWNDPRPTP